MSGFETGGIEPDMAFPTHGVRLAGGMTENGVLTISIKLVYSPGWENGIPTGEEQETPFFAMPLEVFDEMFEGLKEIRDHMRGGSN